jgi:predicted nucleic acid-binding protein
LVQLGLIRLLGNASIMGRYRLSARVAWDLIEDEVLRDERFDFVAEPAGLTEVFPTLLKYRVPTPKLVSDAYLAAFAVASQRRVVTLDAGFAQLREVDVRVLRSGS